MDEPVDPDTAAFLSQHPLGNTEFLLERARAGSDVAWREILRRYRTMLVYQLRARIPGFARHHFDEEALLQDVFAKAWVHIARFEYRGEGSFRRWLARLIVNEFLNQKRARNEEVAQRACEAPELTQLEDKGAAESTASEQEHVALIQGLGELDEEDRDLIIMRLEGLSWDAIAEALECTYETAKVRYAEALGRLTKRVSR